MDGIKAYQDLCAEIEILELRALDLELDLKYAIKMMHRKLPNATTDIVIVPLDKAAQEYDKALEGLQETLKKIELKKLARKQMEYNIYNIKDLPKAVEYQRDALGLPLRVIADRLGYSYDHIKRVSSSIPKRQTTVNR